MIAETILIEIIDTWLADIRKKKIIVRQEVEILKKYLDYKQAVAISGIRRSGKTYLMFQMIQTLIKSHPDNVCYINFEDERFTDDVSQLDLIYRTFLEQRNPQGKIYFFFDEIQNIAGWEKWISRMYEKPVKFFISGSNASLLSKDFSRSLVGRHKLITLFPLSFYQLVAFFDYKLLKQPLTVVENIAKVRNLLAKYLRFGGFPEVVYEDRKDLLSDYFKDIIARDIVMKQNIKFKQSLQEIALILLTNIGRYHSLYSLNKIIKARSINTIKNYLLFLEDAYLLFKIPYFTFSLKAQLSNPFKVYAIDTGLRNAVSFQFSQDIGWLYENVVAAELVKRVGFGNLFYWKNPKQQEVDFVVKKDLQIMKLIQVCYFLTEQIKQREVSALISSSHQLKCNNLLLITSKEEREVTIDGKKISFIPLWKWLLEKQTV